MLVDDVRRSRFDLRVMEDDQERLPFVIVGPRFVNESSRKVGLMLGKITWLGLDSRTTSRSCLCRSRAPSYGEYSRADWIGSYG